MCSKELIKILAILDCNERELCNLYEELGEYLGKGKTKATSLKAYFACKAETSQELTDKLVNAGFDVMGDFVYDQQGNCGHIETHDHWLSCILVDAKE